MFMKIYYNNLFFIFILFFSTLISISSNTWFGCWIGLEINLMSFIPLISNSHNTLSSEASLKYFLVQSIASINFLFMILMKMIIMSIMFNSLLSILINSSLLMKMGSVPFHFWFPNIIEGLSWINCMFLFTWQKIAPMILLSYYFNYNFLFLIMILNVIIGAIGGLNQSSLRKLLTFSSINNLGWMILSLIISNNLWMIYFLIYFLINLILCMMFYFFNMFFLNQLFFLKINFLTKFFLILNLFSLYGLPPFLGFFSKWIIINFMMMNNFFILSMIFIMMSLIMLFYYLRILYSSFFINYLKMKWLKINFKLNYMFYFINFFNLISIFSIIFSTFFFI
uniref:NADH-ubiquinone oxidoreductase chain 2 n=1 Tax=Pennisetia hylaeiformis TaxID=301031 RepID=A0A076E8C3_9NEOP|nr:NADH dehydrogenase subunit 2 [Pennisetia hylaeiformis]